MNNESINWRTFDDDGSIHRQWGLPSTPTYYVIDHEGVIRYKWVGKVGSEYLDAVLQELIDEVDAF